ncbi:uncharacterized protein LOC113779411 [Coffea eugenioides]|uniref:uncharacterized protein LOC113779411 n=1 Tax=Coffea eugenioides TaxID=49369 RepID=UPI000F60577A|nr:uncharacterized protein LOC113779411 [Coffea eugenioides]
MAWNEFCLIIIFGLAYIMLLGARNHLSSKLSLSPFLWNIGGKGFDFHPYCSNLELSYIAFVDDLFLISAVIEHSFCLVRDTIAEFGSLSGLKPNLHKSSVYVAGESDEVRQQLCNTLEMPKGELLVKYLGLSPISTKLSYKDYQPVSMKMQQRVQSWAAKKLTYGGRLQLILSILSGIYLCWTGVFILPKAVLKRIDNMLSSFLWSGEIKSRYVAKVKWEDVYKPKKNGGLGLQNIANWNKCLILKFIWNLCQKNDTLWVKWIHFVILKGHSLKEVKIPVDCSWCWRKLLQRRHLAQPWIKIDIGNGRQKSEVAFRKSFCSQLCERNRRILQHVATSTGQLLTAITKVVQIVVVSWPKAPRIQEN